MSAVQVMSVCYVNAAGMDIRQSERSSCRYPTGVLTNTYIGHPTPASLIFHKHTQFTVPLQILIF